MPFCVASEDLHFFERNSKVEFDKVLNPNQIQTLALGIKQVSPHAEPSLEWGFDLWREEANLKQIICARDLAQIAGQLKNLTQLRYGFSQYLGPLCFNNDTSLLTAKALLKNYSSASVFA